MHIMLSTIFTFAPVPLTSETNPLAVAAELARRRQMDILNSDSRPRHRIQPTAKPDSSPSLIAA
jgi:hypothetical protein